MEKQNPPPYGNSGEVQAQSQTDASKPAAMTLQATGATVVPGPNPTGMVCPSCHHNIVTNVKNKANTKTHILALLCCAFCCCCLPYCIKSCQTQTHYCPSCKAYLGAYNN